MNSTVTLTTEERNFQRYYDALSKDNIPTPSSSDFLPLGDLLDVATEMFNRHSKEGTIKFYMAELQRQNSRRFRTVVKVVSCREKGRDEQDTQSELVGTLLSDVTPEKVDYIWKGRLAKKKLALVDGDPGLGKTTLLFDVAARYTIGRQMPDDTSPAQKGGVVLICLEDGLADTIQPRLARAGADLTRMVSIGYLPAIDSTTNREYQRPFCLATDLPILEEAIKRVDAGFVIIDPIMAILGGKDTYKDNEVRAALAPLQGLAEDTGVAVAMIRHFTKNGGDHAIYRGGGSIAFIGLARIGLMVTKDPDDENRNVLANIKNNLSPLASPLTYSIVSDKAQGDDRPYIKWEGVNPHTVQELMATPSSSGVNRQEILAYVKEHAPQAVSPKAVWEALREDNPDLELNNVTVTMYRMKQAGQLISPAKGLYTVPAPKSSSDNPL